MTWPIHKYIYNDTNTILHFDVCKSRYTFVGRRSAKPLPGPGDGGGGKIMPSTNNMNFFIPETLHRGEGVPPPPPPPPS